jgi:hypothetical protein
VKAALRPPPPPPALRERVLLAAAYSPSRARAPRAGAALAGLGAATVAAWAVRPLFAGGGLPLPALALTAGGAALVTAAALARRRGMFGPPLGQLLLAVLGGPLPFAATALAARAVPLWRASPSAAAPGTHPPAAVALASLVALLALAPPRDPVNPAWNGAAVGAAAGAWLAFGCGLGCPSGELAHLASRHVAFVPALAAAGALLGRLNARRRAAFDFVPRRRESQ